ncbi:MAG: NAD(P)H-dependent oxidoreductase [Zoogloeaceae bacterium]|jgi:NAD(P)H dehydrogenase (quinone)|nr:NAD(P)H-dependent oxidoreductase [Zoogloeaceae bacterium]
MNILIVHAHPEPRSFSSALKEVAVEAFTRQGHAVQVSDLYAMRFDPVASQDDFRARANPDYCVYALEQRHAVETVTLREDIQRELEKLLWCDLLLLNFPLFWYAMPAILKGWVDRVLVSGVTYGGRRFYDRGGLAGKRALVSLTLGGQEHMFGKEGIHGPLEDLLKPLLRGTLGYTGFSVHRPFIGWHIPYLSAAERAAVLEAWRERLSGLDDEMDYLPQPALDDFDERLYRKGRPS